MTVAYRGAVSRLDPAYRNATTAVSAKVMPRKTGRGTDGPPARAVPCSANSVIGNRIRPTTAIVSPVEVSPRRDTPGARIRASTVKTARTAVRPYGLVTATPAKTTAATPMTSAPSTSRMFCTDLVDAWGGCPGGGRGARRGRPAGRSAGGGSSTSTVTPSVAAPGGPVWGVPGSAQSGAPAADAPAIAGRRAPGGGDAGGDSAGRRRVLPGFFFCWLAWLRMSRWNCAA
jgi:hypothetical protein